MESRFSYQGRQPCRWKREKTQKINCNSSQKYEKQKSERERERETDREREREITS